MGHHVQVLTSNSPYLGGDLDSDHFVDRSLMLLGSYKNGVQFLDSLRKSNPAINNQCCLDSIIATYRPDSVLIGNFDLLDPFLLHSIIDLGIHCWHHFGFISSSISKEQLPLYLPFITLWAGATLLLYPSKVFIQNPQQYQ